MASSSDRVSGVPCGRSESNVVQQIRVASVPASHLYVRHLAATTAEDGVTRLPDPIPSDGRTVPGGWWPPLMLDPQWIEENHERFDVFHIQFGFDALTPEQLTEVVATLRTHGKPLVYTVHDLRNPHHPTRQAHDAALDVLVPAADRLLTLTPGAAAEIAGRWARHALVVPHPHMVPTAWLARPRPRQYGDDFVIGVHAKSKRANMDPVPVMEALAGIVTELPGARLQVNVHDEVFDPGAYWYAPEFGARLREIAALPGVDLRVHEYFSDDELWAYLQSLDVSVLPYRFGTHSGWMEACHDLGTAVLAPSCGFFREQAPCHEYVLDEDRFDPESLRTAVHKAYADRPAPRTTVAGRRTERDGVAATHRAVYEELLRS